jgi:serine/threonine protein kinase
MPQFEVTSNEWKIAHQYLDDAPEGTKLPFSIEPNYKSRVRFEKNHKPYQTFHSFIKKESKILALQRGHLDEGTTNKAKYATDEKGEVYIVKIGDDLHKLADSEIAILSDLCLSKGGLKRLDKNKQYMFIQPLGVSLYHLFAIKAQPKNLEDRLDMAIQLSWKLYRLHEGLDSLTRTPYAHLDIKPDNVTMTNDGQLHFIDFGLTEKYPKSQGRQKTQAHRYVAYCDKSKNQVLTKEQYDVIAVKRIIHLPDSLYGGALLFIAKLHEDTRNYVSLLSQKELKQFQLNKCINTFARENEVPDYTKDKASGIMLCALLINARYNLNLDNQKISHDPILMHAITGFYINKQIQHFSALSSDAATTMKLMAGLNALDIHKHYEAYSKDTVLKKALERATTFEAVRALVCLKMSGLETHYETVLHSKEWAEAIHVIIKNESPYDKQNLLTALNKDTYTAKAILFLKSHCLNEYIKEVIDSPALAMALSNMNAAERVIHMLESADELIKVSQDQRLAKAVDLVWSNEFINKSDFIGIVKLMTTSASLVDTCLNMAEMDLLNGLEKAKVLSDSNKCQAFNLLFAANIHDKEILTNVIYSENALQAFVRLRQRKMETLYVRALQDSKFSYTVLAILNQSFADEVTPEMLENDKIRKCLEYFYSSEDKCRGLKILVEMKLIDQVSEEALASFDFKCVCFLKEKGLTSFLKWLIKYQDMGYHLKELFLKEDAAVPTYHLSSILQLLPSEKRLEFIKEVANELEIKSLKNDKRYWQQLKRLLSEKDKHAFSKIIYSDNELADKQTLKNIKSTIKNTPWFYGYYDYQVCALIGKAKVDVPSSVEPQTLILSSVSSGKKTYSEGVSKIKKNGREQLNAREGMMTYYKHTFFGKSETAKYFDLFETDESFERAFVKKK